MTHDELQNAIDVTDGCPESSRLLVASLAMVVTSTANRNYRLGAIQHLLKTRPTTSRRKRPA